MEKSVVHLNSSSVMNVISYQENNELRSVHQENMNGSTAYKANCAPSYLLYMQTSYIMSHRPPGV